MRAMVAIILATLYVTSAAAKSPHQYMQGSLGLHESKNTSQLSRMLGVNPRKVPWCGYMLAYTFKKAGRKPPAGYSSARSWMRVGKSVKLSSARVGDVVVSSRKGRGAGHAGLFTRRKAGRVCFIGGNSSNRVGESCVATGRIIAIRR